MSRCPKTSITLEIKNRVEVEPGVFEDKEPNLLEIKATQESIYQTRRDQALADGMPITARFSTRHDIDSTKVEHVRWRGDRYRIRSIVPSLKDHKTVIELGELI